MRIDKRNITRAFGVFANVYPEFARRTENEGEEKLKEIINTWAELFDVIEFDYKDANNDFMVATKKAITKNRYVPTVSEIVNEMREIYLNRLKEEEIKLKHEIFDIEKDCNLIVGNYDETMYYYKILKEKYSTKEICELIKKIKEKYKNLHINSTSHILKEICEGDNE